MNWILDVVLIAIFVICIIIGLVKRSVGMLISMFGWILIFFLCAWLSPIIGNFINDKGWNSRLATPIENAINTDVGEYTLVFSDHDSNPDTPEVLVFSDKDGNVSTFSNYLASSKGYSAIASKVESYVGKEVEKNGSITIAGAIALFLANIAIKIIIYIALMIVMKLIFLIIQLVVRSVEKSNNVVKTTNIALGGILGGIVGFLWITVITAVIRLLCNFGFLDSLITYVGGCPVTQFFMKYNLVYLIFDKLWL